MTQDHKLLVEAIKCGTVIDHIPQMWDLNCSPFPPDRDGQPYHYRAESAVQQYGS